jgi:hypothetical protein
MKPLVLALAALLGGAAVAAAATKPLVPAFIQHLVRGRDGSLAYVPTRAPLGYRYLSYRWDSAHQILSIRLHDRHYATTNARHTAVFTADRFPGTLASCAHGKQKTIQYDGNKVYWDGGVAWRCVRGTHGNVKLLAAGPALPDVALAQIVSSGKRLS